MSEEEKILTEATESTPIETPEVLLFNRYSSSNLEVKDPGLKRYISLPPQIMPSSGGRHAHKRFWKSDIHICERFANKLMSPGRNAGKKIQVLEAIRRAFLIIELRTGTNPIQILVDAIANAAPREETTRISYGGIVFHSAVDSAPQRRVDISLKLLTDGIRNAGFNNIKSLEEIIAEHLILAGSNDSRAYAVKRKQDMERVALSAR